MKRRSRRNDQKKTSTVFTTYHKIRSSPTCRDSKTQFFCRWWKTGPLQCQVPQWTPKYWKKKKKILYQNRWGNMKTISRKWWFWSKLAYISKKIIQKYLLETILVQLEIPQSFYHRQQHKSFCAHLWEKKKITLERDKDSRKYM